VALNPHINRARWASRLVALVLVSVIVVSVGCAATDIDPIAERTDLPEVCRVEGKWLNPFGPGNHALAGERAKQALVSDSRRNYWLLHPSDCTLQEVRLPSTTSSESLELVELTNSAEMLLAISDGSRPLRYLLLDLSTGNITASRMPQPEKGAPNFPRVSTDAAWAAWLATPMAGKEEVQGGAVERLEARFAFDPRVRLGEGSYHVTDVAPGGREILLEKYPREYLLVDPAGSLLWTFRPDEGVLPSGDNIRLSRDGKAYLAWDSHREQGKHVVQWRVNKRLVRKELPQHSTVGAAAVSPDWKWIAASINANTKAQRGVESLTVWSIDGAVRFHQRRRDGARTPVVFLGDNLFAYNEIDQQWQGGTRVLRLPPADER
jgi:hypothetical protein